MAKQQYLKGSALYDKFLSGFADYAGLSIISRNDILHISIDGHEYYIYLKCVSHKGNPYPLNDQRAQLPQRPIFDVVKSSNVDFLFLGYDMDNDVFVCWDPFKVRQRLNVKSYVSFYSFKDLQNNVKIGKIDSAELSNGDKFVLFKREDMLSFFNMIKVHFHQLKDSDFIEEFPAEEQCPVISTLSSSKKVEIVGILTNINSDQSVKLLVDSMVANAQNRLNIICSCMNDFQKFYHKMQLTDWKRIIYAYLDELEI